MLAVQYIGKRIAAAELTDSYLEITFDDGLKITIIDRGQSCCEMRYMSSDDDVADLLGHRLMAVEEKTAPAHTGNSGSYEFCVPKAQHDEAMEYCRVARIAFDTEKISYSQAVLVIDDKAQAAMFKLRWNDYLQEWKDDDQCHEFCFVEVRTDQNCITLVNHNEHNGYYGGFSVQIMDGDGEGCSG